MEFHRVDCSNAPSGTDSLVVRFRWLTGIATDNRELRESPPKVMSFSVGRFGESCETVKNPVETVT